MTKIRANGLSIETEVDGPVDGVPLLLVRGLGSQLIHWPPRMIATFVDRGFRVIAFDNRDSGLSEKLDTMGIPNIDAIRSEAASGLKPNAPYTLEDMAADGIGVLDALGIEKAHVVGSSMGGMIVQVMAARFPERLSSVTILMSTSGNPGLPQMSPDVERHMMSQPEDPTDRDQIIEHSVRCDRIWGSPAYPFDEDERRDLTARAYDRCYYPEGLARQYAAFVANGFRAAMLGAITTPALVIHGTHDTLLPIEHGRDLAARIQGARLIELDGVGHDLEGPIPQQIANDAADFMHGLNQGHKVSA